MCTHVLLTVFAFIHLASVHFAILLLNHVTYLDFHCFFSFTLNISFKPLAVA